MSSVYPLFALILDRPATRWKTNAVANMIEMIIVKINRFFQRRETNGV